MPGRLQPLLFATFFSLLFFFSKRVESSALEERSSHPWISSECTAKNMRVRKEWGNMPKEERKAYTDAVLCLQSKPSRLNSTLYPGAKTYYDDFVAIHINMTLHIHFDGIFLSWHRNYIAQYEAALRNECGYNGAAPYWDWPKWANNLHTSPLFDGSAYSLSGDGYYNASQGPYVLGPNVSLPHGTGGGCVKSGPFVNYTANLGPFDFGLVFQAAKGLPSFAFDYNPRCFSRDLNQYVAKRYTNASDLADLLSQKTIADFQNTLSGPPGTLTLGIHGGGHLTMGAQGFDFFASPTDPAFFLHHGMIDKVWWDWQMKDPQNRIYGDNSLSGGSTILNIPPSPNVTLTDLEFFSILDQDRHIKELMSIQNGPFCYRYE